jgi:alpha-N-arabinofuranosidase
VNVLQALILTEKEKMLLTPTYHIFDLYKVHHDAQLLPMKISTPDYVMGKEKIPAVNASASRDSTGAIHISLVNLDPNRKITVNSTLNGVSWKNVTGRILTSGSITDINTFENLNKIHIENFAGAARQGNNLRVELPAKSVVVLELK